MTHLTHPVHEQSKSGWSRRRILILAGLAVVLAGLGGVAAWARLASNKAGDRKICAANLKAIGRACTSYADSHQGNFPPSLDALMSGGTSPLEPAQLICPNAGKKGRGGQYVYVPGRRKTDAPTSVLAYEPLGNHKKKPGGHVLLLNGTVKWLSGNEYDSTVAQARARLSTPGGGR